MFVQTLVLLIAIFSLMEIRRQERQIFSRFIERGKQRVPDTDETTNEDEKSLESALHSSKVALWIITVLIAVDFIHSLLTYE